MSKSYLKSPFVALYLLGVQILAFENTESGPRVEKAYILLQVESENFKRQQA